MAQRRLCSDKKACDIPENIKFQTKNEIAGEMINLICDSGLVKVRCVSWLMGLLAMKENLLILFQKGHIIF
jgi:hypothetical protein